jgi:acetyltransferase
MTPTSANQIIAYAPPLYPAHLVAYRCLPDGTAIIIRPIHPQDDAIEREFISGLSSDTRYNRLLGARKLTRDEILQLTHIDYEREMAFVALRVDGGQARLLGVVRYVRGADAAGAEFAIVVADAWQRKGIGSLLLGTLLQHAPSAGIVRLHGTTLAGNQAMQKLARKLGFVQKADPQDATVRQIEKTLAPEVPPAAAHSSAGHYPVAANDAGTARGRSPHLPESGQ